MMFYQKGIFYQKVLHFSENRVKLYKTYMTYYLYMTERRNQNENLPDVQYDANVLFED